MVRVISQICGVTPHKITKTERICDVCGAKCTSINGARYERLYRYDGDELCFECLWDALTGNGTVEVME